MNDLQNQMSNLEAFALRQQRVLGYHMVDGWPVWDKPDAPDEYTRESYAAEQHAPEDESCKS